MQQISKHLSFEEATKSPTAIRAGIINVPSEAELACMRVVAEACFEPLRQWYGKPIKINSFFRSKELNKKVGGSPTSQHCKGQAIDIDAGSRSENKKLFDWAKSNLKYDQLIFEGGDNLGPDWIHISFVQGYNRNETLYARFENGKTFFSK